jgi:hypothetical protein
MQSTTPVISLAGILIWIGGSVFLLRPHCRQARTVACEGRRASIILRTRANALSGPTCERPMPYGHRRDFKGELRNIHIHFDMLRRGTLPVLDAPECQVNSRLRDIRFFWHLVSEVFLRLSRHDEQAPVAQPFREGNNPILPFETK